MYLPRNAAPTRSHVWGSGLTKPGEEFSVIQTGVVDVGAATTVYFPHKAFLNQGLPRAVPFDVYDFEVGSDILYRIYFENPKGQILHDEYALEDPTVRSFAEERMTLAVVVLALAAAGVLVQFFLTARKRRVEPPPAPDAPPAQ